MMLGHPSSEWAMARSDCPKTAEELREWFQGELSPEHIELLVAMEGRHEKYLMHTWTIHSIWDWALEHNILQPGSIHGWIDRQGRWYGCGWAQHDALLNYCLDRGIRETEEEGWCRVSKGTWQCTKTPNRAQRRVLNGMKIREI